MALDVYFRQDIRNALLAAEHASMMALWVGTAEENDYARGYEAGCRSMLRSIALSFGLLQLGDYGESQRTRSVAGEWPKIRGAEQERSVAGEGRVQGVAPETGY